MPKLRPDGVAQKMISVFQVLNSVMCHFNQKHGFNLMVKFKNYLLQNDFVEVTITVFKDGPVTGLQKQTDAKLEIVHPIGFVIETFTWTTDLIARRTKQMRIQFHGIHKKHIQF